MDRPFDSVRAFFSLQSGLIVLSNTGEPNFMVKAFQFIDLNPIEI